MTTAFEHDFLFIRAAKRDGTPFSDKATAGFRWPTEAGGIVEAPDWDPTPECGHGLHGLDSGIGDWGLLPPPTSTEALWYVCSAKRSEAVDLGGKVKVPRCRVVYVGELGGALDLISPMMPSRILALVAERKKAGKREKGGLSKEDSGAASATGESGAASATGESGAASATSDGGAASATGYSGAASATGTSGAASATGEHCVALAAGIAARGMVGPGCLLVLVERDAKNGAILHHFAAMCGTKGVKPLTWYTLKDGKLAEVSE